MRKTLLICILIVGLFLTACSKTNTTTDKNNNNSINNSAAKENQGSTSTTNSVDGIKSELKAALKENAKKYFNADIDENNMNYSLGKVVIENNFESIKELEDLDELYITAHSKVQPKDSGIISVSMEYDSINKKVKFMNISLKEPYNEGAKIPQEEAVTIARKFILDKGILGKDAPLTVDEITEEKGRSIVDFDYKSNNNNSNDIKIGIDNTNKSVRMFDLD